MTSPRAATTESGRDLCRLLADIRRRWFTAVSLSVLGRVAVGSLLLLGMVLVTDRYLQQDDVVVVGLAATAVLITLWFAGRLLWSLRRIPSDREVARYIEERCPDLDDRLTTAVDVMSQADALRPMASPTAEPDQRHRTGLAALVIDDAVRRVRRVDLDEVVPRAVVRRAVLRGSVAVLALLTLVVAGNQPLQRIARVASLYAFPSSASIVVEPGDARVPVGEVLEVRARLTGTVLAARGATPSITTRDEDGTTRSVLMHTALGSDGSEFVAVVPVVESSFTYRVDAAGRRSDRFDVTALRPPVIERLDVTLEYPSFAQLQPRFERDSGDVYAPAGTQVTVAVHTDKGLGAGALEFAGGATLPLRSVSALVGEVSFEVVEDATYRVHVTDDDGLSTRSRLDYFVRAVNDRPPTVEIVRPADDREITPLEEVVIEARADDDFGLERFDLVWSVVGTSDQSESLLPVSGGRRAVRSHTLFAEQLDLVPGDFISYYVRAVDTNTGTGAAEVRSDLYFLEVRPFTREFEASQSQAMGGMEAGEVADLARVQKQIIVATWKLDGDDASDARSRDLASVADAQGELRWAAERAAQKLSARGRPNGGAVRRTSDVELDAMRQAIAAMDRAEASLRENRTATAVESEKDALNQLLLAEAEIRRQQVGQPQGGGSGGGGQAREDVSALFDDELRRDQRTNYENEQATDGASDPDRDDITDAQRRLRELASRQEELTREQQALTADGEEIQATEAQRRRLERLTREQNQLRQEVEDLARELDRETTGRSRAAADLDDISEEMRRAANGLRRGDQSAAAAGGRDAARRIRDLEQRLGEADEGRDPALDRVAGLRREAQHLADDQRRISADARAAGQSEDERRRLATRTESLADAVEALQADLEGDAPSPESGDTRDIREAFDAAAEELRRARVTERTRERANRLRRSDAGPDGDEGGEELAEALERAAGQLAGSSSAKGDSLSARLGRIQDLEERLTNLERGDGAIGGPGRVGERLAREMLGTPEVLEQLEMNRPTAREDLEAWARQFRSGGGPGSEAFKQDLSAWESLRTDLRVALEQLEAAYAEARRAHEVGDRVTAGAAPRMPEAYRRVVDDYYRAIAGPGPRGAAVRSSGR